MPDKSFNDLIGVPYIEGGRDIERDGGLDCNGLFLAGARRFGLDIPDWFAGVLASETERVSMAVDRARSSGKWIRRPRPAPGLAAAFYSLENPSLIGHIGLCISKSMILHVTRGRNSAAIAVDHPFWSRYIEGFYQYAG